MYKFRETFIHILTKLSVKFSPRKKIRANFQLYVQSIRADKSLFNLANILGEGWESWLTASKARGLYMYGWCLPTGPPWGSMSVATGKLQNSDLDGDEFFI